MGDDNGDNGSCSGPDRRAARKSLALEIQSEGVKMPANFFSDSEHGNRSVKHIDFEHSSAP